MKPIVDKIKPAKGYSHLAQLTLVAILPFLLLLVLKISYLGVALALALIFLSKWRMFAVKPRFWLAMIRTNAVDIMVGVSVVALLYQAMASLPTQIAIALFYMVWLIFIKPGDKIVQISLQALIAQLTAFMALFLAWPEAPLYGLVFAAGVIAYLSARHFFDGFSEPYSRMLAYLWAYFTAALVWVLGHWLLFYGVAIAQPTIIITTVGYGLAVLYYFDHYNKLTTLLKRQLLTIMLVVLMVVIVFSDWGDKVV